MQPIVPPIEPVLTRIGLLSDSHGRAQTTHKAAQLLVAHGATLLLHLGDIGSVEVVDAMVGLQDDENQFVPVRIVFGNTDWDAASIQSYAQSIGVAVDHPAGILTLDHEGNITPGTTPEQNADTESPDASSLVFTHGHLADIMENALTHKVRYLCHGHTHVAADQRVGPTRTINPGALFRAKAYTVAILDTASDQLTFYPVVGI